MTPPLDNRAAILVVDDEPFNRELLSRLLGPYRYVVASAGDGEAALAAMDVKEPDLVLLDVQMPGMDGFAVCRRIKQRPTSRLTPVILVTGIHDREHKLLGIAAGADDFLSKPYDAEELTSRVASLVRVKRYTDELESAESVIVSLALTIEARDPYTDGHCQRLAEHAAALGARLNLEEEQIAVLHRGGLLHDVGKIGIPDAVLLKTSALTPAEFDQMKTHTTIGERLCGELRSLAAVRPIVRHHHERRDGSGYPDGLRGDAIPLLAQIIGIVDVYDAMITARPYRAALPRHDVRDILLSEAGRGLHRLELVHDFLAVADTLHRASR